MPHLPDPTDRAPSRLPITVLHGDLSVITQPLMLGHYRASELTGTESVVNRLIGGTMAQALAVRQYPERPGTQQCFANRHGGGTAGSSMGTAAGPAFAVVVGLGEEGSLRASDLSLTVRQGVLALAQRLVEHGAAPTGFELASTLLGSGGVGISAGQSAQAIAQGVCAADRALAALNATLPPGAPAWPRVARLLLIELYLSRAGEAWRALRAGSEAQVADAAEGWVVDEVIDSRPGGLRRPPEGGYRGASNDHLRALGGRDPEGQAVLNYSVDTRQRARTEQFVQPVQARLLRQLVSRTATDAAATDPDIGRVLFQLLVPDELAPFLSGSSDMVLQLDATTAGLPWELLDDGRPRDRASPGDAPWALRARLIRTLQTTAFRAQPQDAGADAGILVIGEPRCDGPQWPRLPGARQEALAVSALLAGAPALRDTPVDTLVSLADDLPGPEAQEVIGRLFARDWRVVHIAGHGALPGDAAPPARPSGITDEAAHIGERLADADTTAGASAASPASAFDSPPGTDAATMGAGVVLSGGTVLGPAEIHSLRVVPELVFINACHQAARPADELLEAQPLGRVDRARFASSVADALIRLGVRCVVAAGWAVEDQPAADFASAFYRALLRGARFIDAVAEGRAAAWRAGGNTWAAYQCYGDPNWRLLKDGETTPRASVPPDERFAHIASAPDLALALETIAIECRFQGRDAAERRTWLAWLAARHGARWGGIGAVAEAFGVAWEAAGVPAQAHTWLARARDAADGSASLQVLQRLAALPAQAAARPRRR